MFVDEGITLEHGIKFEKKRLNLYNTTPSGFCNVSYEKSKQMDSTFWDDDEAKWCSKDEFRFSSHSEPTHSVLLGYKANSCSTSGARGHSLSAPAQKEKKKRRLSNIRQSAYCLATRTQVIRSFNRLTDATHDAFLAMDDVILPSWLWMIKNLEGQDIYGNHCWLSIYLRWLHWHKKWAQCSKLWNLYKSILPLHHSNIYMCVCVWIHLVFYIHVCFFQHVCMLEKHAYMCLKL